MILAATDNAFLLTSPSSPSPQSELVCVPERKFRHQADTNIPVFSRAKPINRLLVASSSHIRVSASCQMRAVLVIALCLALAGSAAAGNTLPDANHYYPYKPPGGSGGSTPTPTPTMTAWEFITSRDYLTAVARVLEALGRNKALSQPFAGTLLLPNNEAMAAYIDRFRYIPTAKAEEVVEIFWGTLMNYLTMPSATLALEPAGTTKVDTTHERPPPPPPIVTRRNIRHPRPPAGSGSADRSTGGFHTLTLVRDAMASAFPKAATRTHVYRPPLASRGVALSSVVDEHNDTAAFVSKDNAVIGGGVVHVMDAVLQPDDLYPSFSELAAAHPEISGWVDVLRRLSGCATPPPGGCTDWVTPWNIDRSPAAELDNCYWSAAVTADYWTEFTQEPTDTCLTYDMLPTYNKTGDPTWPALLRRRAALRHLQGPEGDEGVGFAGVLTYNQQIKKAKEREAINKQEGTASLEIFAGTYALPDNKTVDPKKNLPDVDFKQTWPPIVRYHFVSAGAHKVNNISDLLVGYSCKTDGKKRVCEFKRPHNRDSFLAQARRRTADPPDNPQYQLTYKAVDGLIIDYPTVGGEIGHANIDVESANLQTPAHFYHIIDKLMIPPCKTDTECNTWKK